MVFQLDISVQYGKNIDFWLRSAKSRIFLCFRENLPQWTLPGLLPTLIIMVRHNHHYYGGFELFLRNKTKITSIYSYLYFPPQMIKPFFSFRSKSFGFF